jgi:nitroreductase
LTVLFDQAPVLLFLFVREPQETARPGTEEAVRADVFYAGSAAANLALAARSLGLGVAPLGLPRFLAAEADIAQLLEVTEASRLVGILALGWPSLSGTPAVARPVSEILAFERWNGPDR